MLLVFWISLQQSRLDAMKSSERYDLAKIK